MFNRSLIVGFLTLALAAAADAADVLNPVNGHYYRAPIASGEPWAYAKLFAFQQIKDGQRGHLVTITSEAEQAFVKSNFLFLGGYWTGGFQPAGSPEPNGNWQWITDEPFEYTNWYPGGLEPNNNGDEFVVELFANGYWNDTHIGSASSPMEKNWIVEFTPGYVPSLDGADFLNWQRTFGRNGKLLGDFSGNWMTDADDLDLWRVHFGGGVQSPTAVPEASAALLATLGLAAIGLSRRVRRLWGGHASAMSG